MRRRRTLLRAHASPVVLGRPWFLVSLAVLVLNDHVLKARYPGPVTGKLSDLAGPAVVAALAAVVIGRTAAVAAVAIGFAALKTLPGVAEAAQPVLGGITRRDPTDLIGLVVLPAIWWAIGRPDRPTGTASGTAIARPLDVVAAESAAAADWLRRRVLPLGGAALALVALTATSSADPAEVKSLATSGPTLYAELGRHGSDDDDDRTWAFSDDAGATWEELEGSLPADATSSTSEACRSDGHCYAARGATIETKAPGGEWIESFSFEGNQREVLDYRRHNGGSPLDELFESVVVVPAADGEVVVVGAQDEGVAVLGDGATWERSGVLNVDVTSASGATWPLDAMTVVLFASLPVGLVVAAIRAVSRGGGTWKVLGSIAGALLIALALWAFGVGVWALGTYTAQNPILLALVLGAIASTVVLLPLAFVRQLAVAGVDPAP